MSQAASGYERIDSDLYCTPAWVVERLPKRLIHSSVWEPACGQGHMAQPLFERGCSVQQSDINPGGDFQMDFVNDEPPLLGFDEPMTIITNPPYGSRGILAVEFIERALELTKPGRGNVLMLLPVDFDSASTRKHIFGAHIAFSLKITLTERIRWANLPQFIIVDGKRKKTQPTMNHAWFNWDWQLAGRSTLYEYL